MLAESSGKVMSPSQSKRGACLVQEIHLFIQREINLKSEDSATLSEDACEVF